jgi:heat shock protein HslJ
VHNDGMSARLYSLLAIFAATATLAGCVPYSDAENWVLTRMADNTGVYTPATADLPITLTFDNGGIQGTVCNSYSAPVSGWGSNFTISWIASTEMACMDPANAMEIEARYLQDLGAVTTISRDGATLQLTGPDVTLEFMTN